MNLRKEGKCKKEDKKGELLMANDGLDLQGRGFLDLLLRE
jgi:hypothetical protein